MHSPRLGLPVPHRKMSPQLMSTAGTPQQAGQAHGDLLVGLSEEFPPPLPTPSPWCPCYSPLQTQSRALLLSEAAPDQEALDLAPDVLSSDPRPPLLSGQGPQVVMTPWANSRVGN